MQPGDAQSAALRFTGSHLRLLPSFSPKGRVAFCNPKGGSSQRQLVSRLSSRRRAAAMPANATQKFCRIVVIMENRGA
jgi:hypothetical protein